MIQNKKILIIVLLIFVIGLASYFIWRVNLFGPSNIQKNDIAISASPQPTMYIPLVEKAKKNVIQVQKDIEKNPGDASLYYEKAKNYYIAADYEQARESMSQAIAIEKTNGQYYKFLGDIYTEEANYEQAASAYSKSITILGANSSAAYELASLYLVKENEPIKAEQIYRNALDVDGNNVRLWVFLGKSLEAQSKIEDARASYQKALSIDSSYSPAQIALDNLK